jgi:hypothetical protein
MTNHPCHRRGRTWADRHPAAAVTAGLFTFVFMAMMLSVHPLASAVLVALAGVGGLAYLIDRERGRRAAVAARAEHDYRAVLAAPVPAVRPLPQRRAHTLPWQIVRLLDTEPLTCPSTRYRPLRISSGSSTHDR